MEGLPGLLPRRAGRRARQVEALVAKYRDARGQLVTFAKAGQTAQFIAYRSEVTTPITKDAFAQLDAVSAIEKKAAQDMAVEGSRLPRAVTLLLLIGAVAVAVAVVVAVLVARSIARPLARTLTVVEGLAEGRLDQKVGYDATDEVGRLATALDATVDRLATTLRRISARPPPWPAPPGN